MLTAAAPEWATTYGAMSCRIMIYRISFLAVACVEEVDYRSPRGLDGALFQKLIAGGRVDAPL